MRGVATTRRTLLRRRHLKASHACEGVQETASKNPGSSDEASRRPEGLTLSGGPAEWRKLLDNTCPATPFCLTSHTQNPISAALQ
eukprot:1121156-Pyramimonas_sp.AAC.1